MVNDNIRLHGIPKNGLSSQVQIIFCKTLIFALEKNLDIKKFMTYIFSINLFKVNFSLFHSLTEELRNKQKQKRNESI